MPVVLATAEGNPSSGYTYDDRTGVSYEYPTRYQKLVVTGEPFVYHMSGRGYTGMGIIGDITSSGTPGRLICEILGYEAFDSPVALRGPEGYYYEADPEKGKFNVFWSQGVRPISTKSYEQIVWSAPPVTPQQNLGVSGYASPEVAILVESISMAHAVQWLEGKYPDSLVVSMPHNNPGYDIRVGVADDPELFVEVKGTQTSAPVFWLSEGERKFSIANANKYLFIVVSGIDLKKSTKPILTTRAGALEGLDLMLEPAQWRGSIKAQTMGPAA